MRDLKLGTTERLTERLLKPNANRRFGVSLKGDSNGKEDWYNVLLDDLLTGDWELLGQGRTNEFAEPLPQVSISADGRFVTNYYGYNDIAVLDRKSGMFHVVLSASALATRRSSARMAGSSRSTLHRCMAVSPTSTFEIYLRAPPRR